MPVLEEGSAAPAVAVPVVVVVVVESTLEAPCASAQVMVRRLMWLRSSVRAPAIIVDVVELISVGSVDASRSRIDVVTCSSTTRNGRYLLARLADENAWVLPLSAPFISTSPS